ASLNAYLDDPSCSEGERARRAALKTFPKIGEWAPNKGMKFQDGKGFLKPTSQASPEAVGTVHEAETEAETNVSRTKEKKTEPRQAPFKSPAVPRNSKPLDASSQARG
ncbi:unnamed protein product, partial [Chrysoparadoxa australica]